MMSLRFRASLIWFLNQIVWGLWFPFYPMVLKGEGAEGWQITPVLALFPLALMLASPLAGKLSGKRGDFRVLQVLSFVALPLAALYLVVSGFTAHVIVSALFLFAYVPTMPLSDVVAGQAAAAGNTTYGAVRMWGAVGFFVAVFGGGYVIDAFGIESIFLISLASLVCNFALTLTLKPTVSDAEAEGESESEAKSDDKKSKAAPNTMLLIFIGVGMYAAAHGLYDSGITLHLAGLGVSEIGLGWAWGIAQGAEVIAFGLSGLCVARFGTRKLLMFVFAVAAIRWGILGVVSDPTFIFPTQALHAITFSFFVACMVGTIFSTVSPENQSAAMGYLHGSFGMGQLLAMLATGSILSIGADVLFFLAAALVVLGAIPMFLRFPSPATADTSD